jgi:hypothetical protein
VESIYRATVSVNSGRGMLAQTSTVLEKKKKMIYGDAKWIRRGVAGAEEGFEGCSWLRLEWFLFSIFYSHFFSL